MVVLANVEVIVTIVVVLFTLAGGIINVLKEKKAAAEVEQMRERRRREQPVEARMNDELESFLEEISGQRGQRSREQAQRRQRAQRERAERQRRRQQQRRRTRRPDPDLLVEEEHLIEEERPERVAQRHLERNDLSAVDSRHIDSQVAERHLESSVADQHLIPTDSAGQAEHDRQAAPAIINLLKQPGGVRNAIVLNEILSPPVSRRKSS